MQTRSPDFAGSQIEAVNRASAFDDPIPEKPKLTLESDQEGEARQDKADVATETKQSTVKNMV